MDRVPGERERRREGERKTERERGRERQRAISSESYWGEMKMSFYLSFQYGEPSEY